MYEFILVAEAGQAHLNHTALALAGVCIPVRGKHVSRHVLSVSDKSRLSRSEVPYILGGCLVEVGSQRGYKVGNGGSKP